MKDMEAQLASAAAEQDQCKAAFRNALAVWWDCDPLSLERWMDDLSRRASVIPRANPDYLRKLEAYGAYVAGCDAMHAIIEIEKGRK